MANPFRNNHFRDNRSKYPTIGPYGRNQAKNREFYEREERHKRNLAYAKSKVTVEKEISSVVVNSGQGTSENSQTGEQLNADNPLIQTTEVANAVAEWVKNVVTNRTLVSGEYRADPRVDAYDKVFVENKYMKSDVILTDLEISYNGAYTAKYKGRVVPKTAKMLSERDIQ